MLCTRAAVVTGGAQGIGRGLCLHLLRDSREVWGVVAVDFDKAGIADAERVVTQEFGDCDRIAFVEGDCADPDVATRAVTVAVSRFRRVDLLVNNAGGGGIGTSLGEQSRDFFMRTISSNLGAAHAFSRAAASQLQGSRGSIVNIASTRALMSEPNSEPYAAAKGGIVALTHALAVSLGPEITVNCICPGWIDVSGSEWGPGRTQAAISDADRAQHPCGRVGTPLDVAEAAYFLARAKFITGQVLTVDGGMSRKMIYLD
jgi:NAD(P)-dependent dehydrogenase (short-subunit alcohol dehydrogenase family)